MSQQKGNSSKKTEKEPVRKTRRPDIETQKPVNDSPDNLVIPGSFDSQAETLGRLDKQGRHEMVGRIGTLQGNKHVQRLVGELHTDKPRAYQDLAMESPGATSDRDAESKGAPPVDDETRHAGSGDRSIQRALTPEQKKMDLKSPQLATNIRLQNAYDNSPVMGRGATGEPAKKVQQALLDNKFPLPISTKKTGTPDGIFGKETQDSIRKFQGKHSLSPDGRVGRQTLDKMDKIYTGGGGGGPGGGGGGATPPTPAPSATLNVTGDGSYTDTAAESRKIVKFNVGWKGGKKEDYVVVNWLKGYMKNSKGKPYKVQMYGKSVDFNFADWRVDSVDPDPVYWSEPGVRWGYTVVGPGKFYATDNPGPMLTTDGKGAKARVDFKVAVYKSKDVEKKTSGSISATPITSFVPWTYHVEVLGGGKFKHNKVT